jgi:hypothetical protein
MPGEISLSFEREPAIALAASIEGDVHQTVVARTQSTGEIAGLVSRSGRDVFVNGTPTRLGYLSQLRVARGDHALRTLIDDGFAFCKTLHDQGDTPAYLVSVVADNDAARRLLVDRRSAAAPRFWPVGEMDTFVIPARPLGRHRGESSDLPERVRIERGSSVLVSDIADCLRRNLRRYQFAPSWSAADLRSNSRTRGLSPEDFVVALDHGRVIGCVALWNQRLFKQVVVRGYHPALRRARPLMNAAARVLGLPRLPPIGEALRFAYLSHIAVDDDRAEVLGELIAMQMARARTADLDYVVAGFPDRHPFQAVVRRTWARRTYRSALYLACWPDGDAFVRSLDDRPAQPEVAVL